MKRSTAPSSAARLAGTPSATPADALDWSLVQTFVALHEAGSLGRAAERLGLSQPTLSRRLAELEAGLGQALFERTARGLRLTAAGQALREPAERMRAEALRLRLAAQHHERSLAGTVRVTASEAVSNFVLLPVIRRLRQAQPQIQIELVPSDTAEDLLQRDADIAVRMFRPTQPSLTVRRMADMPLGVYASRAYIEERGLPTRDTMDGHDWIGMDRGEALLKGFAAAGRPVPREFFGLRCDSSVLNWNAVCAGLGIGVGLQAVAARTPGVVRVLHELAVPSLPVWLAVHRELRGTPRLRVVFDVLADALAARPVA
jgi:DNA-binding transcriptional LysR family regulator